MSAASPRVRATAVPLVQPRPTQAPRPALQVVRAVGAKKVTAPTWTVVVVLMIAALVVPMLINTDMAVVSYQMHSNQVELNRLNDEAAVLVTQVQEAQSPNSLAKKAQAAGLVQAPAPGYISLRTSSVVGGSPATGG
ncbi:MAG: hypothetical protein Q4G30_09745 [Actinomycetaceae bacterium]|nr:hypothetical protein [Actinomycetaceae bacterium]